MTSLAEEDDVSRFISALSNGQHSGTSGSLENSDTMQNGPSDPSEIPNNIANHVAHNNPNYVSNFHRHTAVMYPRYFQQRHGLRAVRSPKVSSRRQLFGHHL